MNMKLIPLAYTSGSDIDKVYLVETKERQTRDRDL
jgi:hypothetical protein